MLMLHCLNDDFVLGLFMTVLDSWKPAGKQFLRLGLKLDKA